MSTTGFTLDGFAGGALLEQVVREVAKVAANVHDPNTSATVKRSVSIKLEFKPGEDRQIGDTTYVVTSGLCSAKGGTTRVVFGYDAVTKQGEMSELNADMLGQVSVEEIAELAAANQAAQEERVIDFRKSN